jgi:hypothetical protein
MKSIDDAIKPKKGRPPVDTEPVNVRLPVALLERIDEWRAQQRPIPTRPAAIRAFVEAGLHLVEKDPS